METSSDDDGDADTGNASKFIILSLSFLFLSYNNSPRPLLKAAVRSSYSQKQIAAVKPVKPKTKNKKKKLYITFDDGPNRGTKNVFTIVKDEQVSVTFFIVGQHVFASSSQAKMWDSLKIAEHIALCNHSFSHANSHYEKYYSSPDSVVQDFKRTHDTLQLNNEVSRTPGRNIWRIDSLHFTDLRKSSAAADSLANSGYILMGWDLEWQFDHKTMSVLSSAENMIAEIDSCFCKNKTKTKDHLVLLAHDQAFVKSDDSIQLREFFRLLKQRSDWEFSLATDYPNVNKRDSL